jgi:tetratricopeptide (TPR) repeat protein
MQLNPKLAYPHNGLGTVYTRLKDYDRAIAAYGRAIELEPKYASPYLGRGVTYVLMGDLDQAEADHLRTLELDPHEGWVYASLANVYRHRGAGEQCATYLAEARQRIPVGDDYAQACLASIAGDADAAIDHLARALEQDVGKSEWARQDPDLHWIRDDPRYQALVGEGVDPNDSLKRPSQRDLAGPARPI